jgi:hypothetical protein
MGQKVYARMPFGYGGKPLDRGEITELQGLRNDEKLLGLKYFVPFNVARDKTRQCDNCGRTFVEVFFVLHQKKKDCFEEQPGPSKAEIAESLDVDPDKMVVDPPFSEEIEFDGGQVERGKI